jgi:hypothetical protein
MLFDFDFKKYLRALCHYDSARLEPYNHFAFSSRMKLIRELRNASARVIRGPDSSFHLCLELQSKGISLSGPLPFKGRERLEKVEDVC